MKENKYFISKSDSRTDRRGNYILLKGVGGAIQTTFRGVYHLICSGKMNQNAPERISNWGCQLILKYKLYLEDLS